MRKDRWNKFWWTVVINVVTQQCELWPPMLFQGNVAGRLYRLVWQAVLAMCLLSQMLSDIATVFLCVCPHMLPCSKVHCPMASGKVLWHLGHRPYLHHEPCCYNIWVPCGILHGWKSKQVWTVMHGTLMCRCCWFETLHEEFVCNYISASRIKYELKWDEVVQAHIYRLIVDSNDFDSWK